MSIFSDIIGLFKSSGQKNAIGQATAAQVAGANKGIGTLNTEDARIQALLAPYTTAGGNAVGAESNLLGLGGPGSEQRAVDALRGSPAFTAPYQEGVNTILANGSATGGLRGGNIQHSLASFGGDLLNQVIQQRLAGLSGLSGQGLTATGQSGTFGAESASGVASLQDLIGKIQASGILGKNAVTSNMWDQGANLGQDIWSSLASLGGGGSGGGGGISNSGVSFVGPTF